MKQNILIVDDDKAVLSALDMLLRSEGFVVVTVDNQNSALAALNRQDFSLVLTDLNFSLDTTSGKEGLALISAIRNQDELIPIVVMTGWGTIEVAVSTMQKGANDFIQKPWDNDRLLAILNNQIKLNTSQKQSQKLDQHNQILQKSAEAYTELVTYSPAMKNVMDIIEQVAHSDVNVLLTGENGTGKSMFARYIHKISKRNENSMISINMGAVTESLFESEMFGHLKGAFTDAKSTRIGRFELADEGTLFLDEIANTPYSQQNKLLRVLEDSNFEKVGSSKTQTVDIRLITATNADLNKAVEEGSFRKDLLYRINTICINIPSLQERTEDILPLANSFLLKVAEKYSKPLVEISKEAEQALKSYSWPGNVRELSHMMERAQILCKNGSISEGDLGLSSHLDKKVSQDKDEEQIDSRTLQKIESQAIEQRLEQFKGNATKAYESLGLSKSAFYRRLEKSKSE